MKPELNPLKKVFAFFVLFALIGAFISLPVIQLFRSFLPENIMLVSFSPIDVFTAVVTLVVVFALTFTVPFALVEAIRFVRPALYEKEKKLLMSVAPFSSLLFAVGAVFGVYVMVFVGLRFFAELGVLYGLQNFWSLSGLVETILLSAIVFGLTFQMPIALVFLVKYGFITRQDLVVSRGLVLFMLLLIGAVLTPPDLVSQLLMAFPLYLLYEGTLLYLKMNKTEVIA